MENLGNTFVFRPGQNNRETAELIQTLANMFTATHEIDFLDNAIGLAQELSLSDERAQPLLEGLLGMRSNFLEQANTDSGPQDAAKNRFLDVMRNMEEKSGIINTLYTTFEGTGDIDYLDSAIEMAEELIAEFAPEGLVAIVTSEELAALLTPKWDKLCQYNLSLFTGFLSARYKRTGRLEDIDKAIKWMEIAVAEIPPNNPLHGKELSELSMTFFRRYEKCKDLEDLEQTIKRAEEAVAATPPDHPDRASMLSNLGNWLGSRYERLGDLQDLEQATKRAEEAVAATPPDHPNRASMLNNLGNRLRSRYERLGDLQDLEQATKRAEEAVAATPLDHPNRAARLGSLVTKLISRYQRTDSVKDFNYILRISYEAWYCRVSPPKIRINIAYRAGLLLATRNMWQESSLLLEEAAKMLPKVSSRSLGRGDQEHHLSDFTRLASEAAAIAFQAGAEATQSLRLLEFGRGIITGLVIDCRNDLSELQSNQPKLFDKFHKLRTEIDSPLVTLETDNDRSTYQQKRRRREEAVQELEETLNSIRQLPGHEGFQLPPQSDDLMAMASEGPIVIFNSTRFRSDAIIVTSSTIKTLALPELLYSSVKEQMSQIAKLVQGRRSTYPQRNEGMREILLWLWKVAVEPVFKALQQDTAVDTSASNLPRIWWIGVGLLAMAPFHAAGDHSPGSTCNTISRAISSYIPTIKSLLYARQKKSELLSRPDSHFLLVTMPTTPAEKPYKPPSPLKNATKEVEKIADIVKGKAITTQLHCPSTAQVIAELPSYHAIHFACHGVSDGQNPSNSYLILRKDDGSEMGTPDKLTVGAISNTNIKQAQIAYLSACCTAENSSAALVDESIYIASGFQLAGFSHVLATQWVSKDDACLEVARDFYSSLFSGQPGGGEEGHRKVSASFHYAVKKLRDRNLKQPIKWACYIHTGA